MSKEPKRVCKNCTSWVPDPPWGGQQSGFCTNLHFEPNGIDVVDDDKCFPYLSGDDCASICTGPLFGCRFFKKKGVANAVEIPTIPDNG